MCQVHMYFNFNIVIFNMVVLWEGPSGHFLEALLRQGYFKKKFDLGIPIDPA